MRSENLTEPSADDKPADGNTAALAAPPPAAPPTPGFFQSCREWLRSSGPGLKIGTLQYTGLSLLVMCLWLFWGDMVLTLSEDAPRTIALQLDRLGISKGWMGYLMGTFGASINFILVPVVSFRSDRTRSRWGRRIPYILASTLPVSLSLLALGFTDDIGAYIGDSNWPAFFHIQPISLVTIVVGTLIVLFDVSNILITTCWWYLLADVIPKKYMTRFMALFALVGTAVNILWQGYFYPRIETNVREIYCGAAALYFFGFLLMCLMVREGQYAPPEPVDMRDPWLVRTRNAAKLYFKQSFVHPLILMYFARNAIGAITGACGFVVQLYYLRYLHLTLAEMGAYGAIQLSVILVIKLPIGWFLDRYVHPMQAVFYPQILLLPLPFIYFYLGDYTLGGLTISVFMMWVAIQIYSFPIVQVSALSIFPLQTRIFPRSQFGQFGSANSMGANAVAIFSSAAGATFMEWTTEKFGNLGMSYAFLWSGTFSLISFVAACVLFHYWHLFGGRNFELDLDNKNAANGISKAALWRPIKIGAAIVALILASGAFGLVVLAHRPDMGFVPDNGKELTNAKSMAILHDQVDKERAGFKQRHEANLKTLAAKHIFYRRDTVTELHNYQQSNGDVERAAREAQVSLAGRALKKAKVSWCITGQMAVDYALKDNVTADVPLVLAVDKVAPAVKALEGAGFKTEKLKDAIKVTGLYGLEMQLGADAASDALPQHSRNANVPGTSLQGLRLAGNQDALDWEIAQWKDASRPASAREKNYTAIKRLVKAHSGLRKDLPPELQKLK